jgi:hypothetical protein
MKITEKLTAYCIVCKKKQEIVNPVDAQFKNGTPIKSGTCPQGHKIFKICKKIKAAV